MISWAVFVSGEGTNLQNFLDLEKSFKHQKIHLVVADKPCRGIERAKAADKDTLQFDPKAPEAFESLLKSLNSKNIDSIFLLGFMRIIPKTFLRAWSPRRIVNLHPSLLPDFKGKEAVRQAVAAQSPVLGVSLHEVVADVDSGRILRQLSFPRDSAWTESELMEKVHQFERKIVRDYLFDLESVEATR